MPRKYYPVGGSQTVSFYTTEHSYVRVTFHDGRTIVSKTLRDVDALKRALLNGGLTTTPPATALATIG